MRILTFSTLYPNAIRPQFGIFVETRLGHLVATGAIEAQVVAPCPWFPSSRPCFGDYAAFARVPHREMRNGLIIHHPRYPVIPKIGMSVAPALLFAASLPFIKRLIASGEHFDAIDAHYMYPDGVAAVMLASALDLPLAVTCRGTDINVIPEHRIARRQILWAARRASCLITVSEGLRDRLIELGVRGDKIRVLRNGVDLDVFHPLDRAKARAKLGFSGPILLAVGNLVGLKGHDLMIMALKQLPGTILVIVGDGPLRGSLERFARQQGLADRVRFVPRMPQEQLREYYTAADLLLLASKHEGWPNVLLESIACGTPVLASNIPGAAEIVRKPEAGRLLLERNSAAIAEAARELLNAPPDRNLTHAYAKGFSWESTTQGQIEVFQSMVKAPII